MITKGIYQSVIGRMIDMALWHHAEAKELKRIDPEHLKGRIVYHRIKRDAFLDAAKEWKRAYLK